MSTYYKILCDQHRERTDAASRSAGGWGPVGSSASTLPAFIIAHAECGLRSVSEHHHDYSDDRFREWGDVDAEVAKATAAGRWIPPGS